MCSHLHLLVGSRDDDSCGHATLPQATISYLLWESVLPDLQRDLFGCVLPFAHIFKAYSFRSSNNIKMKIKY